VPFCLRHQIIHQPVVQSPRFANGRRQFGPRNVKRGSAKLVTAACQVALQLFHVLGLHLRFLFAKYALRYIPCQATRCSGISPCYNYRILPTTSNTNYIDVSSLHMYNDVVKSLYQENMMALTY